MKKLMASVAAIAVSAALFAVEEKKEPAGRPYAEGKRLVKAFEKMDADGDGLISKEEAKRSDVFRRAFSPRGAAGERLKERLEKMPPERQQAVKKAWKKIEQLSPEERKKAVKRLRQRLGKERGSELGAETSGRERIKRFLQQIPAEKREQIVERLRNASPEERRQILGRISRRGAGEQRGSDQMRGFLENVPPQQRQKIMRELRELPPEERREKFQEMREKNQKQRMRMEFLRSLGPEQRERYMQIVPPEQRERLRQFYGRERQGEFREGREGFSREGSAGQEREFRMQRGEGRRFEGMRSGRRPEMRGWDQGAARMEPRRNKPARRDKKVGGIEERDRGERSIIEDWDVFENWDLLQELDAFGR